MAKRPRPAVITAAAQRIIDPQSPNNRSHAPDARALYALYDQLGPIHNAMQTKFYAASKITYYPARKTDADMDPEPVTDGPAFEAYDRLRGPMGEFADFVAEMAMHWEIVGEGYLYGRGLEADEEWDVISAVEYDEVRRGQPVDRSYDLDDERVLEGDKYFLRCWRSHPMRRMFPDSPLRAIASECEQFILFRDVITALAKSRLLAPIFIVPSEVDFPDTDDNGQKRSFGDFLLDSFVASVQDTRSAGRIAPITLEVAGDRVEQFKVVDLTRDLPEWLPEMLTSIGRNISIGLDMPPEVLTGLGDMNHWSAWLTDDSLRLNYVDPLILSVLDSLTRGYLHPELRLRGVSNPEEFLFWRDYSDLTSRTVTAVDVFAALDHNLITGEAARRSIGFTEADAPEDGQVRPGEAVDIEEERDIPSLTAAALAPSLAQIDHRLYTQISEAAQAALDRALERAGAKARRAVVGDSRKPPKDPVFAAAIAEVDDTRVCLTLGKDVVDRFQLADEDLIPEGIFDRTGERVRKMLQFGLDDTYATVSELTGAKPPRNQDEEDGWLTAAVAAFVGGLGAFALRRLFTPTLDEDPAQTGEIPHTEVPASLIFETMTIGGGGAPGVGPDVPRGLATGQGAQDWITSVGYQIRERVWTVGAPAQPFEPHRALSGTRFAEWTSDRLKTPLTASWLGYDFMFPGDHRGCQCVAELVIEQAEDLFPPIAASA